MHASDFRNEASENRPGRWHDKASIPITHEDILPVVSQISTNSRRQFLLAIITETFSFGVRQPGDARSAEQFGLITLLLAASKVSDANLLDDEPSWNERESPQAKVERRRTDSREGLD